MKIKEMTDEELLREHEHYKHRILSTLSCGKSSFCVQTLAQIEVELDNRNIKHLKLIFWDFGDADWFKKLVDRTQGYDHIIIDPKGETKLIGQLIRNSIQNGRDPSRIVLHLPNGDALRLSDLDDEKAGEVLNAMFGLNWTDSEGKYAKCFNEKPFIVFDEQHELFLDTIMSRTRQYNPKIQLKTANPPFYRQLEKKKWY